MTTDKNKIEIALSSGRVMLETGCFNISAEEQRLLIILLITNAPQMGTEEQERANGLLKTLLNSNHGSLDGVVVFNPFDGIGASTLWQPSDRG